MTLKEKVDSFLKRHPIILVIVVIFLTVAAGIVLLGQLHDVGLVYKAF